MNVVLREDVEKLGSRGDVVSVAAGYARNYLVPRGLAIMASRGAVKEAEAMRRSREAKAQRSVDAAKVQATAIEALRLQIAHRAGEGGKLFGSVTAADIATAASARVGFEIDRHDVEIAESIREVGSVVVKVRLHEEVTANLTVDVNAE